ncbi:MAG TPA: DUF1003 domain-containing protein [Acetobacteraceae bacterium]|nr:DUF1003 domain-containing protein [Acetobacteraceae bacterium]
MPQDAPEPPQAAQQNIDTIVRIEEAIARERTTGDRVADAIATFSGTISFALLHVAWFVVLAVVNTRLVPGIPAFDPYPFQLLAMLVSLEAVLLSTFVLIKQNRMGLRADRRSHLDLQINLLAEKEITKVIQMLDRIADRLGATEQVADQETRELGEVTAVDRLAHELHERLPDKE